MPIMIKVITKLKNHFYFGMVSNIFIRIKVVFQDDFETEKILVCRSDLSILKVYFTAGRIRASLIVYVFPHLANNIEIL